MSGNDVAAFIERRKWVGNNVTKNSIHSKDQNVGDLTYGNLLDITRSYKRKYTLKNSISLGNRRARISLENPARL